MRFDSTSHTRSSVAGCDAGLTAAAAAYRHFIAEQVFPSELFIRSISDIGDRSASPLVKLSLFVNLKKERRL